VRKLGVFAQYFIRDVLKATNPAQVTGELMLSIGLALMALVFPAGYLSDRIGRKRLNVFAGLLGALGTFLFTLRHRLREADGLRHHHRCRYGHIPQCQLSVGHRPYSQE
jgi:Na+/melibiose symporter-like transporter